MSNKGYVERPQTCPKLNIVKTCELLSRKWDDEESFLQSGLKLGLPKLTV